MRTTLIRIGPVVFRLGGLASLVVLFLGGLSGAGCRSSDVPASASFASVRIEGRTLERISETTLAVFGENGYRVAESARKSFVFEKIASKTSRIVYGNWYEGPSVWVRVKASITQLADGAYRLQCITYMVRDPGDARFEEEVRLANFQSGPYQKLLNTVAKRLE